MIGLNAMHLDGGELSQDVGHVGELGPVELKVLARGEVAVAAIVNAGDVGQHPHLPRGQRAVGNGDAQHVGVELEVEPVHEPERLELVLGELAVETAPDLAAELLNPLVDQRLVELIVAVHQAALRAVFWGVRGSAISAASAGTVGPLARMRSRWETGASRSPRRSTAIA